MGEAQYVTELKYVMELWCMSEARAAQTASLRAVPHRSPLRGFAEHRVKTSGLSDLLATFWL